MPTRRVTLLAVFCLTVPAAAQQNSSVPKLSENIDVSIVNLDVIVTDKRGAHVHGLTKDDFEIRENGKSQPITNFAEYRGGAAPPPAESQPQLQASPPPGQPRTLVLFVDRFYLPKIKADPFFAALKETLHRTVRPGDSLMIATWYRGLLRIRHSFEDLPDGFDAIIDAIANETVGAAIDDFQQAKREADEASEFEREAAAMAASHGATFGDTTFSARTGAYGRAKIAQFEQKRKISTLQALIRAISANEGKKLLLLATHRLSNIAGAEFLYAAGQTVMDIGTYTDLRADLDLRALEQTANANGVTVYTMYPEGLLTSDDLDASNAGYDRYSSPTASGSDAQVVQYQILENETLSLGEISRQTGGTSEWGPNSAKLLASIEDDLENYYSLAYRVRGGAPDRPRNLVVNAKNREYVVRSRRSVVAKSEVTRMEDRVISALFRAPESSLFHVSVAIGTPRPDRKKWIVPITLQIPIASLTALPDGNAFAGAFSVYAAWGSKFQRVSETTHDTKLFRIPAGEIAKARQSHYTYSFDVLSDGKADRLSLGVLDEVSKDYALRVVDLPNGPVSR
jgi:VWFA-related protein